MYKLNNDLHLKIVESQELYRNKDDFRFFSNKKFFYFNLKDFIFSKSLCKIYYLQNDHRMTVCMYSVYKVDYRGAAAPKKDGITDYWLTYW